VPKPYRFPGLFVVGIVLFAAAQDPALGIGLAVAFAAIVGLLVGYERWTRRRARARRAAMPYGTGLWRARVEPLDVPGLVQGFSLAWLADALAVDVVVESAALRIEPSSLSRPLLRVHSVQLRWEHIHEARVGGLVRELSGKPVLVPLHDVRLVLVGDAADDLYELITDEEAAEESLDAQERAELDAETLSLAREQYGEDWVPGTQPVRLLLLEDPEGFAETVRRYARGVLPTG
jgi:hypothetical protein